LEKETDWNYRQGEKQMLTKIPFDSQHDEVRRPAAGDVVTTVTVDRTAANANSWINEGTNGRRQRRMRRMVRATNLRVNGWTVRTW